MSAALSVDVTRRALATIRRVVGHGRIWNRDDRAEVEQTAALRLVRAAPVLDLALPIEGIATTIARRAVAGYYRARADRARTIGLPVDIDAVADWNAPAQLTQAPIEPAAERAQESPTLARVLALPEVEREPLLRLYVDGGTFAEVAEERGWTVPHLRYRVLATTKALRAERGLPATRPDRKVNRRLAPHEVRRLRRDRATGMRIADVAAKYNVSVSLACRVANRTLRWEVT